MDVDGYHQCAQHFYHEKRSEGREGGVGEGKHHHHTKNPRTK